MMLGKLIVLMKIFVVCGDLEGSACLLQHA